jgi:uncharacterized protein DUF4838
MRRSFSTYVVAIFILGLLLNSSVYAANDNLDFVQDSKSDYTIVLPAEPTPIEKTAASELQNYLEKATGAKLPIVAEKGSKEEKRILIGATVEGQKLLGDLKLDKLDYDRIVLKRFGDQIILAGHPQRGTLYAVYTFLEDQLGVRWWTPDCETVPNRPSFSIAKLDKVYAPKLRIREPYCRAMHNGLFAARNKCNGSSNKISAEFGGHQRFCMFVHTFYRLLPPEKYFQDHPEWYSLIDGHRKHDHAQLCLTNEAMRKELTKNALERLRKDPTAALISISQNDCYSRCECEKCKAIEEAEGSPAGLLLQFVNKVAEDIEKEFPEVLVETLAYVYTRKPPKTVRPRENVVVRLCSIECSFAQPLDSDANAAFRDDIRGWAKIAPQLYVWDYVTNFEVYQLPHPNLRVLAPNIRFFEKNNVIGLFEQGDCGSNVGDFIRMRAWLLARLMWDSSQNADALIDEFLNGYYGPAGKYLKKYLTIINDAGERENYHLNCFEPDTKRYLKLDDLNRATRAFDKAEKVVANRPELAMRVDRARMSLDLVWILRYFNLKRVAELAGKQFLGPKDPEATCKDYIQRANKYKMGQYSEHVSFNTLSDRIGRMGQKPITPKQCENLPISDWLSFDDNRLTLREYGTLSKTVNDPKTSDGKTAFMTGSTQKRLICHFLKSGELAEGERWRCFVTARAESKATEGSAIRIGIWSNRETKDIVDMEIPVKEATGGYKTYDLGAHEMSEGAQVWISAPKLPNKVDGIYVDQIFFIREK